MYPIILIFPLTIHLATIEGKLNIFLRIKGWLIRISTDTQHVSKNSFFIKQDQKLQEVLYQHVVLKTWAHCKKLEKCLCKAETCTNFMITVHCVVTIWIYSGQQGRSVTSSVVETVVYTVFWLSCLLGLSYQLSGGSWTYLQATYGFIVTVPELTPNMGIYW